MSLCLKVRGPGAPISMVVSGSLSWSKFKDLLTSQLSLHETFDVLYGFPPRIEDHPDERTIGEFLSSGENIRVQLKASAGQQAQGSAPTTKAKKASQRPVETKPKTGFGAKIVGLKASMPTKLSSSSQKRSVASLDMKDQPVKKRRKSSASGNISSENDIADHLISAVSGGTGTHNRAARKVFRNAVLHQYNSTQAVSRVNAIYSGKYSIRECGGVLLSSTSSSSARPNVFTHIEVTYSKGSGSRGEHVETVELLSRDILLGVLKVAVLGDNGDGQNTDEGKEVLKPMNLSKCSPRIFWSLVHQYGPNLVENIRSVLKGVDDCAWLDERKKQLSEKALENLQQQNEVAARRASSRGKKSAVTIEPVTTEAAAQSPSREPSRRYVSDDPVTQEVLHQIQRSLLLDEIVPEDWRQALLTHLNVESTFLILELARLKCSPQTRDALQDLHHLSATLSLDQLESWIVSAQVLTFHAVWRLICGGGCERLRSVLYKLRVRVPKDFHMWRHAPEGLLQGVVGLDASLAADIAYDWPESVSSVAVDAALTVEKIGWMCRVAQSAQGVLAWIDDEQLHYFDESDNKEEGEDEDAAQAEEWLSQPEAHPHIGKRARVLVENDYWEDGTVVGYLPPEPEEPTALWRVRIDAPTQGTGGAVAKSGSARVRNEDMEEHELEQAFRRLK